jgi:hypothetical protein
MMPAGFRDRMAEICADPGTRDAAAVALMVETLRSLGYRDGLDILDAARSSSTSSMKGERSSELMNDGAGDSLAGARSGGGS